jgi:hypothetical protein
MIGRWHERRALEEIVQSPKAEFAVVYGRRRIGKTLLVRETLGDQLTFYYTGAAKVSARTQLAQFVRELRSYGHEPTEPVADWFDAFHQLRLFLESQPTTRPLIVFLDELPWMDNRKSTLLPALESFWNGWGSNVDRLTLIACGSATSWITNKVFRNKGGLYNRVTRQILLRPFTLAECRELLDSKGIVWSLTDLIEAYMVFGGVPYYLDLIPRGLSLPLAVDALCFAPDGRLRHEFPALFDTLFSTPERHEAVVRSLASKQVGLSRAQLADAVGFPDGGNLTKVLKELEESGFVREYQPFGRKRNGKLYQLSDPFTAFHLRFIQDSKTADHWSTLVDSPKHRVWAGLAFEQVCLAHVAQIRHALGISGVHTEVASWRSAPSQTPGGQIDLLLDRSDGVINLCEMKFAAGPYLLDAHGERAIRERTEAFRTHTNTKKALHPVLVTPYGITQNSHSSVFQAVITGADLLTPLP